MSNDQQSIYKAALMQHFKQPYNKHTGSFPESFVTARGRNPSCGDDIEVGIKFVSFEALSIIEEAGFRGRGCSVCLASASMMAKVVEQMDLEKASMLVNTMGSWIDDTLAESADLPSELQALDAVKKHPARKKCVMLAWHALNDILKTKLNLAQQ